MKRSDANEKSQCPFNPSHLILHARMGAHIEQCRKNYPNNKKLERCNLNANHWFPPHEREQHYRVCTSVPSLQRDMVQINGARSFVPPLPEANIQVENDSEDWDTPPSEVSYLAVKDELNAKKQIVQLGPTNVGKAQRRLHIQNEKERHRKLQEEEK